MTSSYSTSANSARLDRRYLSILAGATAASAGSSASGATTTAGAAAGRASGEVAAEEEQDRRNAQTPKLRKRMVGFMLAHEQFPAPELVKLGARADEVGFDLLATSDHFQPWQANQGHSGEAWVTLGELTKRTRKAWLGPTVCCPTLRYHPAVVAETFATLNRSHPGRIFLGVGSGEALNEQAATGQWPAWRERWDRLIEASELIRKLWTGEDVTHEGKYYQVKGKLYDPPVTPIPLLMAANGPKAMRLAGAHGDGLVTDPQTWKQSKSEWQAGVRASGGDPGSLPVLVEQFVVVGDKAAAQEPAQLWRFLPSAFKGYHNIADPREIQRRAEAEIDIDKLISDWTVATDPAAHVKAINALFDSGVSIVNIHSGQHDQKAVIDFYGEHVLPKVRGGPATTSH